ncbi:XdhC family protein [Bdellovibrio sp. KM01]|uniref:XdhC family protein n=1 Tax=Bdellovibrio sp. KM01 TaxID=2748865 RepID=UPI0015EA7350|nr:XdhC family protein [Bdellovibrio sp. KM01]QLY26338.1 XdhC family protein [Bdellovibrio sp. KM01]
MGEDFFGLGIERAPVGETIQVDIPLKFAGAASGLAATYGWRLQINDTSEMEGIEFADVLIQMAAEIARARGTNMRSLREVLVPGTPWIEQPPLRSKKCVLYGRSRVTESLERHLMLLDFQPRIETDLSSLVFRADEIVIVGTQTPRDLDLVACAVIARSSHVAIVGDDKRAQSIVRHLNRSEEKMAKEPVYLPAGVDIGARNPDETALSIVVEILLRGRMN